MGQYSQVVFMGLGYIGLPTAAVVAGSGQKVLGVDINPKIIDTYSCGEIITPAEHKLFCSQVCTLEEENYS